MKKIKYILLALAVFGGTLLPAIPAHAYTFDSNDIIDDSIYNNFGSMSASQIDTFLNNFPKSCISSNSGFLAEDPTGYNPTNGFLYGGNVTAGQVIFDASQAYGLNPQVLITTLQKEEGLVDGSGPYGCSDTAIASSVGYGCPDGGATYSYSNINLYTRNGTTVTSISGTCVNSAAKTGFSQQIIHAAWLLKFGQQRSWGNIGWAVIKGNWDNSDDPQSCYGGPTMQGTFAVCPSSAATYHDGYYTIDGTSIHINSGATAALYWYTPHFSGNQSFFNIFTQWFGSAKSVSLPGCNEATNTARSCVWYLTGPSGQPFFTSSLTVRQELVDNENYTYHDVAFFGNVIPLTGNIPVYLVSSSTGGAFLTANKTEYNNLVAAGYTDHGIDFYADPSWSNTGYPVYRLYNPTSGLHFWTSDPTQRATMLQGGYNDEGIAFTSISTVRQEVAPPQGKLLTYRFNIPQTYSHFWTTDVNERDSMIRAGYDYEGVSWDSSSNTSLTPVYRLYASAINQHLYTIDPTEKDRLVASGGWNYEGISQYVSSTPNSTPVYRLYLPYYGVHMFTSDAYERSSLLSSGAWKDEGIAWYQP